MPSRGSLIWDSTAADTIWRMRTASFRARAGSAIGTSSKVEGAAPSQGPAAGSVPGPTLSLRRVGRTGYFHGGGRGGPSSIHVAEQLPVRREQRHLRSFGQQPLARIEDVG